jgi:hypothetical protein
LKFSAKTAETLRKLMGCSKTKTRDIYNQNRARMPTTGDVKHSYRVHNALAHKISKSGVACRAKIIDAYLAVVILYLTIFDWFAALQKE